MQTLGVDVAVLLVGCSPIEVVVAEAIDLNLMGPYVGVESLEVVFVDETELRCLVSQRICR
jgi:hypothetical protein